MPSKLSFFRMVLDFVIFLLQVCLASVVWLVQWEDKHKANDVQ